MINRNVLAALMTSGLFIVSCSHTKTPAPPTAVKAQQSSTSLKETFKNDFLIGTCLDVRSPTEFSDAELAIIKSQFNIVTPENSMKPASIHPQENTWNWTTADATVKFCEENNIQISGHCLVWHNQTPAWFFTDEKGNPVTKEKAIERMKTHIETEVGHFKGKVKGWDVVNEAIWERGQFGGGGPPGDGTPENLRMSPWYRAIGPEYLTYAFKFAHEADPGAELYYNDFNIERGAKHASSMALLKRLLAEGAPITAVGIQGHWSLNFLPYAELDKAISDYQSLGLKVNISELDVTLAGAGGGQLNPTSGPTTLSAATQPATTQAGRRRGFGFARRTTPPTTQELKSQADAYAKFFEIFEKHKDAIERVTFWGINDTRTWRPGQAPLLFDTKNQPKPALFSIIQTANAPTTQPSP
jgi:GH35 family endo-1,4-beta-xylanase